jgi:hypothetical protein
MRNLFFRASTDAFAQITDLFDFVAPTATALWNLRWQVAGYVDARPGVTKDELDGRFSAGSGVRGANLRRSCISTTWGYQQEYFARIVLLSAFSIHESWMHSVLQTLGASSIKTEKDLQSPSAGNKGINSALNHLRVPESTMLVNAFYPQLLRHRKNSLAYLEPLMMCYRFFKETRNAMIHGGGIANSRVVSAYQVFVGVATSGQLGVKEVPEHSPAVLGQPLRLSLRGVIGFSDIILKLIATVDAELSRAPTAERELAIHWKTKYGQGMMLRSNNPTHRSKKIKSLIAGIGLPQPVVTGELDTFLKAKGLII